MHLDVVELRSFYYHTPLGAWVQRLVRSELRRSWPNTRGMNVVGMGFAAPFLRPFLAESARVLALMPAQQGVMHWPRDTLRNLAVLTEDDCWPLPNGLIDRLLIVHGLEVSDSADRLLAEAWRTLAPGGRAVVIVPNRRGFWSKSESTPFGHGRSYSLGQITRQLQDAGFASIGRRGLLFAPPFTGRAMLRAGMALEGVGRRLDLQWLAGAHYIELAKVVYARPKGRAVRVVSARPALGATVAGAASTPVATPSNPA